MKRSIIETLEYNFATKQRFLTCFKIILTYYVAFDLFKHLHDFVLSSSNLLSINIILYLIILIGLFYFFFISFCYLNQSIEVYTL